VLRRILIVCAGPLVALCVTAGVAQAKTTPGLAGGTLAQPLPATTGSVPTFDVYATGETCDYYGGGTTDDSDAYAEQYTQGGKMLTNYEIGCVANTGSTTVTHTEEPAKTCVDGAAPHNTPAEQATFADGEEVLVCDEPDVTHAGHSRANRHPFKYVAQGFKCEATVGTGASGNHATNIRNKDSIEFDQDYKSPTHLALSAISTTCVGTVPAKLTVSSTIVSHEVKCSQDNPFGSGTLPGYGQSFTFPDRQYEEAAQAIVPWVSTGRYEAPTVQDLGSLADLTLSGNGPLSDAFGFAGGGGS
jgi:hypothetical protein